MTDNVTDLNRERYNRIDQKLDRLIALHEALTERVGGLEERVTTVDYSVAHVHKRLDTISKLLVQIDQRLVQVEKHADLYKEKA